MKIITITNGVTQLILLPENDLEKEIVKKVNGGTASLIADNNSVLNTNVSGGLLIRPGQEKKEQSH